MKSARNLSRLFSFHFPYVVVGSLILLVSVLVIFSKVVFHSNEEDFKEYRRLVVMSNPTASDRAEKAQYTASQERTGVQKDILYLKGNDRLQMRLISSNALLVLDHHLESTELIENMQDVKCYMQEELYYVLPDGREASWQPKGKLLVKNADPAKEDSWIAVNTKGLKPMQVIRYLEADTACYHYDSDLFKADNVSVSRYVVPGHDLVESIKGMKLVMAGKARAVEFSLAGKDLNFNAHQMKAKFYTGGRAF